ncbi:serine protease [Streptomyces griseosporeus]|uniref:serine protease n=1 Tax=Streptomyces griseosporeus TaxID=1910 RepID=UPI00367CE316
MGHEDYWLAISQDGTLLGGGFFVTRSYALTSAACVRGVQPGTPVDLHTAAGLPLEGRVLEVAEDVGLALIGVVPDPFADYATPLADHAVKGDAWQAPYRPSPVAAALRGTVDAVTHDRHDGDGRPVCVIELTSDQSPRTLDGYAGGPVERRTDGQDPAVVGVLLAPDFACRLREGADSALTAGAIDSAVEAFDALSAENLMGLLHGVLRDDGQQNAGPVAPVAPADEAASVRRPAERDEAASAARERTRTALDTAWTVLREFKQMVDESLVDARSVEPFHIRVLEEVVREAWREDDT